MNFINVQRDFTLGCHYLAVIFLAGFQLELDCPPPPHPRASREVPYCRSPTLIEGQVSGVHWRKVYSSLQVNFVGSQVNYSQLY